MSRAGMSDPNWPYFLRCWPDGENYYTLTSPLWRWFRG